MATPTLTPASVLSAVILPAAGTAAVPIDASTVVKMIVS